MVVDAAAETLADNLAKEKMVDGNLITRNENNMYYQSRTDVSFYANLTLSQTTEVKQIRILPRRVFVGTTGSHTQN